MKVVIWLEKGRIFVSSSYEFKETCQSIPGARWDSASKRWYYPPSPWTARRAVELIMQRSKSVSNCEVVVDEMVSELANKAVPASELIPILSNEEPVPVINSKFTPWRHQYVGASLIQELGGVYLAHDMGCGKTKTTIDAIQRIHQANRAGQSTSVLIVCPAPVVDVWNRELVKHATDPSVFVVSTVGGKKSVKDRAASAGKAIDIARRTGKIAVVVSNYEAFVLDSSAMLKLASETDWSIVVADEAHRLASPGSKTSMAFSNRIGPKATRRVALSGTPLRNSPLDVYAQCRFLDPGVFGTSSKKFLDEFAVLDIFGAVVGVKNEDELARRFGLLAHRVDKRAVLKDLPPVMITSRRFKLSDKVQKAYDTFEDLLSIELEKGEATAANSLVKLLRLAQLTSGYLPVVDPETGAERTERVDGCKAAELEEYLSELPTSIPVVVFCRFRHDLDEVAAVAKRSDRKSFELSGRTNELREWQDATGGEVLVVQIQAGGIGVDLTRSCYGVFYSIGYGLSEYEQAKARLDRPGQTRPVTLTHLIANGTVDETIFGALAKKADAVEDVIARIRKGREK